MTGSVGTVKLQSLAKTIRSKNAGVDKITFDIVFPNRENYELVRASRKLTRETIATLYGISAQRITDFVEFDPANAIKFTIMRTRPSGSPGDPDIFGAQQYAPLLDLDIPADGSGDLGRERPVTIGETIDQLITLDLGGRGVCGLLYRAARAKSELPLALAAARALATSVEPGSVVVLATGWLDRPAIDPSVAETDGPLGAAVLARIVRELCGAAPFVLVEEELVPAMTRVVEAAGLRVLSAQAALASLNSTAPLQAAAVMPFPTDPEAAASAAVEFCNTYPVSALVAVEKGGMNDRDVVHTSRGADTTSTTAKIDYLVREASKRGVTTIGIGDGGNELGMALIKSEIEELIPRGRDCGCGCGGGIAPATATDHLVVAATSNWGAYGVAACLAATLGRPTDVLDGTVEERMLRAAGSAGLIDGITGTVTASVDGIPLPYLQAVMRLLALALTAAERE